MRRDDERLTDILDASEKIAVRAARGREQFDEDEDLQFALVHLVRLVGEAASKLSDELTAAHPEVPWRQVVGMRNRMVHGYFEIDLNFLWDAATQDIPDLAEQVRGIAAGGEADEE